MTRNIDHRRLGRVRQDQGEIANHIIDEFAADGITFDSALDLCPELLVRPGVLTRRPPSAREEADIAFGWGLAKEMGRLDVGQSVAVKERAVLAVEAIEGTDRAIARAGELCRAGGFVVVKVAKPQQDMRFDVPTVGRATVESLHRAGGRVLGVMPEFLRRREILYDEVETIVVRSMHERKMKMFEQSDAFAVLPGGIGTLEEVVELLSWRRLELHSKPIVFVDLKGYWRPFFALIDHTIREKLTPSTFPQSWITVERVDQILPALTGKAAA